MSKLIKSRNNRTLIKAFIALMIGGAAISSGLYFKSQQMQAIEECLELKTPYSNIGNLNLNVEFFDINGNILTLNSTDLEIYKKSNLNYYEETGEYEIKEDNLPERLLFYGNKFVMPINIYIDEQINKTYSHTTSINNNYNIEVNNTDSYYMALINKNNVISLNNYKNLINITKDLNVENLPTFTNVKKEILPSLMNVKEEFLPILDDYVIIIKNEEIKDVVLKMNFQISMANSKIPCGFNNMINVDYTPLVKDIPVVTNNVMPQTTKGITFTEERQITTEPEIYQNLASDYSTTGVYIEPVSNTTKNINIETQKYIYQTPNGTYIKSITDNGKIKNMTSNSIEISYNDKFSVLYKNIIPTINMTDIINASDIIGISLPNKEVEISYKLNDKNINCDWMFDGYIDPIIGANMPLMLQGDLRWGMENYGSSTIATSGCGPTSFSMVLSYLKNKVYTPGEVVEHMEEMGNGSHAWCYMEGKGSYYNIFDRLSQEYDLRCEDISTSYQGISNTLLEGKMIIICICNGPVYRGDGHFIVIRGITEDGYFLINDSAGLFNINGKYRYSDLGCIKSGKAIF